MHHLAYYALQAIGLMRETFDGDWKATRQLKELFLRNYDTGMETLYPE